MTEPPAPPPYWSYPPPQLPAPKRGLSTGAIVGIAVATVVGLFFIAAAALLAFGSRSGIDAVEVTVTEAGCGVRVTKTAPLRGIHVATGDRVDYPDAPPAFGRHWGNYLQGSEIRSFYTVADRPPVERLVHSLEHGYTILWYDASVTDNKADLDLIRSIAATRPSKFIAAPWTAADGPAFREGTHVALTHWSVASGVSADTVALRAEDEALGVWEYCRRPSREAVEEFLRAYPFTDSPEPNAP